jgi:RNA polymerase sigma-70 factor (ECF subfamily)
LSVQNPEARQTASAVADESRLIALLQSGDPQAFEQLFRTFAAPLCDLAYGYLQSRDAAEEVVQDLFVRLWATRHAFSPQHSVRAYLFGAVRNRSLNVIRDDTTASRIAASLSLSVTPTVEPADAALLTSDLATAIQAVIAGMPPRCREVFTLVRTQSLSYAEVAAILDIAPKTVEVHMGRALAILRARLSPWLNP